MTLSRRSIHLLTLLLVAFVAGNGQTRLDHASAAAEVSGASQQVRLKLIDGSIIEADEAWESEQGVWYRRGGMNHLIAKDRIKVVERDTTAKPKTAVPVAKNVTSKQSDGAEDRESPSASEGPVWIYLVGGARFEADTVTESAAGAWYRRGPLSVFVERSRIDHIERELETMAESDSSSKKARGWTTGNGKLDALIKQNGSKYGVDPYLIFCVMEQESHFNSRALSPKGARGLMQLMPGTSARFGIRRPSDPGQNIAGGTRYLKQLLGQFNGRIDLVLASYNAGEGAVMKFGGRVPPYRETREYVKRISSQYRKAKLATPAKGDIATVGGL
ncbi:MAG TPA: lytic transglycosylase domain-containing protein [Pyrinomonadaceae bacterium]|jgi:Zn-finger nucleic acid-binding protein|nr:lytic transglycosylase domain-containing protein [Pyrinomonadaceae bacterium]